MDEPILRRSSGFAVCILNVMVFEPCPKRREAQFCPPN